MREARGRGFEPVRHGAHDVTGPQQVVVDQRAHVIVVLDDQALALIKLKQAKMQMAPRAVDFAGPRFDLLAQGFGIDGVRVGTQADFERAFDAALASGRPTIIDAFVDPSEYWEQM